MWDSNGCRKKLFLHPNSFTSGNYGMANGTLGEIPGTPRTWRDGSKPAGTASSLVGTNQCGPIALFDTGQSGPGSATFDSFNVRTCCAGSGSLGNACLSSLGLYPPPPTSVTQTSAVPLPPFTVLPNNPGFEEWRTFGPGPGAPLVTWFCAGPTNQMIFRVQHPIGTYDWTFLNRTAEGATWRYRNDADPHYPIGSIAVLHLVF